MKAFLRIVRLPNVITAACNSLAGAFCAGVGFDRWGILCALALVSMSIYAAGILLNDLFDLEEDRIERPDRPLPAGDIRVRTVVVIAISLILAGMSIAWTIGPRIGLLATILLASVIGYNAGLKRTALGPWVMGLCRGTNFGLGLVAVQANDAVLWLAPAGYVVYVAGVTYVSRQETRYGQTRGLTTGFVLIVAGIFAVMTTILVESGGRLFPQEWGVDSWRLLTAILILFLLTKSLSAHWQAVMTDPSPKSIGGMVKAGVISLPLLDFAQTLSMAGLPKAAVIAGLWLLARIAVIRLYAT